MDSHPVLRQRLPLFFVHLNVGEILRCRGVCKVFKNTIDGSRTLLASLIPKVQVSWKHSRCRTLADVLLTQANDDFKLFDFLPSLSKPCVSELLQSAPVHKVIAGFCVGKCFVGVARHGSVVWNMEDRKIVRDSGYIHTLDDDPICVQAVCDRFAVFCDPVCNLEVLDCVTFKPVSLDYENPFKHEDAFVYLQVSGSCMALTQNRKTRVWRFDDGGVVSVVGSYSVNDRFVLCDSGSSYMTKGPSECLLVFDLMTCKVRREISHKKFDSLHMNLYPLSQGMVLYGNPLFVFAIDVVEGAVHETLWSIVAHAGSHGLVSDKKLLSFVSSKAAHGAGIFDSSGVRVCVQNGRLLQVFVADQTLRFELPNGLYHVLEFKYGKVVLRDDLKKGRLLVLDLNQEQSE